MPRARNPQPLLPNLDRRSYGSLRNGAKDNLVNRFLRWTFSRPDHTGTARQLRAGQWLPMQPYWWRGEHLLGEGGMGIVHLWCCIDNNNRIRDRVIVKQVHPGVRNWERRDVWRNGEIGGEPRESMLGNGVYDNLEASQGNGKFVTQCLGYGGMQDPRPEVVAATGNTIYRDIAAYKLYFEYCPFGDLRDAIIRQREAREPFHEGFIWMTFEALAECAVAMDQSNIVHSDITTSNILLSTSDPERFKIWPVPKLADFGSSRTIDEAARRRLTGNDEAMHPYSTPPELTRDSANFDWAVSGLHVTNKTNVWSIGLMICCLMRLQPQLPETDPFAICITVHTLRYDLKKWHFRRPQYRGNARALQQGGRLPIQTSRDDRGQEQPLGDGGLGVVHLWCCVDANNRVIDRVIVKNVFPGTEAWALPSMWRDGHIGGEPREAMISNEVYDQLEAANAGDGQFVTRCLGYGNIHDPFRYDADGRIISYLDPPLGDPDILGGPPRQRNPLSGKPITYRIPSYKLYFEYCPHGDLHTQIMAQGEEKRSYRVSKAKTPGGHPRRKLQVVRDVPFHEGFIWRMFEALAKCAVAMERANVLHGDLCPTNIFLGASDPNRFKIWPIPKLSDFGSSRHIDFMTRNRFGTWEEAMQVSFTPPELARPNGQYEVPGLKVTYKTNVWQVGMVIACMMRLDVYLPETDWRTMSSQVPRNTELHFDDPYRRELRPNLFQHRDCHYSAELIGLVQRCMRFHQIRRPTPQRLLAEVQQLMQGRCGGTETYTGDANGRIPWNKKEKLPDLQPDKWQEVDQVFVV
ncbi:kinase-like protein, partial [Aureobasidium melanogenum]